MAAAGVPELRALSATDAAQAFLAVVEGRADKDAIKAGAAAAISSGTIDGPNRLVKSVTGVRRTFSRWSSYWNSRALT